MRLGILKQLPEHSSPAVRTGLILRIAIFQPQDTPRLYRVGQGMMGILSYIIDHLFTALRHGDAALSYVLPMAGQQQRGEYGKTALAF